jgi:hypothetical protein
MAAMSFRTKLISLSAVIGVLAAAYVLGLIFSPASVRQRELETPLVVRLEADSVAKIRLMGPDGSLTLEKRGDEWLVPMNGENYPAADSRIEALLDFVQSTKRSRLVTSNPEAWKDFGVDAEANQKIEMMDATGAMLLGLIVGKVDEGRGGTYVRLESANEVVLVNRMFDYYLNTAGRFWSYLRMFPADLEGTDINRVSLKSPAGFPSEEAGALSYTLLLGEGRERNWKVLDSAAQLELDNAKVDRLANALAGLEGADFAPPGAREQAGLDSPRAELLVSTAKGQDFRLLVGNQVGEDRYYAALEGGEYVYEVARFRLQALFKPLPELAREEAPAPAAN